MKLNLNPDPNGQSGGGTPPADWRATLPDDIKASPSIAKFKSVDELAKSYINAESLIGTKRIPAPQANWTEKEWDELYKQIGRPETPDKYQVPEFKFEEGLEVKQELVDKAKLHFHKIGLTPQQAKGILEYYFTIENERFKDTRTSSSAEVTAAEEAMKKQFGKDYDVKVSQAKALLQRFDTDGTMASFLNESKLGNDARMLKFLASVADKFKEDSTGSTGGLGMSLPTTEKAKLDIAAMKSDSDFMEKFIKGEKWAVDKWNELHRLAFPQKAA